MATTDSDSPNPGRYEIIDTEHPTARGLRFGRFERAEAEWSKAVPRERFIIVDRRTKTQCWPA